jgi:hypothetical protein
LEVTAQQRPTGPSSNTLLVFVDEAWTEDDARTLLGGLDGCRRDDAGLLVLVLFREGLLERSTAAGSANLRELAARLHAPLVVNEDVHGGWSHAFVIPRGTGEPAWRLISPDGAVRWMHDGRLAPEDLAHALDDCLSPSPRSWPSEVQVGLEPVVFSPAGLASVMDAHHPRRGHCPPIRSIRDVDTQRVASAVSFVHKDSSSSSKELLRLEADLKERTGDQPAQVVVVLDGADPDEASELNQTLGADFTVVADPDGTLAGSLGVRFWPTTVTIGDQAIPEERPTP